MGCFLLSRESATGVAESCSPSWVFTSAIPVAQVFGSSGTSVWIPALNDVLNVCARALSLSVPCAPFKRACTLLVCVLHSLSLCLVLSFVCVLCSLFCLCLVLADQTG